ncbi:MAG TPA: flagellar hook-basal body complex protein FliE [Candidatus Rifleibacterium sp.]|nr:flagellar hook-basal body complex protein FliE [Candidatus Rifleibacterium sp.]HPT45292.1 flagellar hook-basal body complex protein FliE [Candidatus Rifleibacterium sp.]
MKIDTNNPMHGVRTKPERPQTNAKEQWNSFLDQLQTAIGEVDQLGKESEKLTQDAVLGRVENLHDVMIAAEKAKTAMNLTLEVRGKALEAYKEIMRMNF